MTADPDITVHEHTSEDEFLVIACDGELGFLMLSKANSRADPSSHCKQESGTFSPLSKSSTLFADPLPSRSHYTRSPKT